MTNYCWYYHDRNAGAYHAIERHAAGPHRHKPHKPAAHTAAHRRHNRHQGKGGPTT